MPGHTRMPGHFCKHMGRGSLLGLPPLPPCADVPELHTPIHRCCGKDAAPLGYLLSLPSQSGSPAGAGLLSLLLAKSLVDLQPAGRNSKHDPQQLVHL